MRNVYFRLETFKISFWAVSDVFERFLRQTFRKNCFKNAAHALASNLEHFIGSFLASHRHASGSNPGEVLFFTLVKENVFISCK